ncbi:hypothetical protein GCM10027280_04630 [Micromonospora polyrhachis]|nr:hypothetical protein [Micromonospora polyrhachis]
MQRRSISVGSGRAISALLVTLVMIFGMVVSAAGPAAAATQGTADHVVLVGVAGLRWEDVNQQDTPTLWRLAEQGSIGSLSVRSARQPTCPVDGWLTLGAGNYAAWDDEPVAGQCPELDVAVEQPDGTGAQLPAQRSTVQLNKEKLSWGAVPGALAESVRCAVAVGPGAAVAAARPFGRVDRYEPTMPEDPAGLLSSCALSIVDLGMVAGEEPAVRAQAARVADAGLARLLAARPERSLVIVAGVSDTDPVSRLHVAVADGPGWERGWLTSASTGREGYVQLIDLAPTALTALGRPMPERLFIGQPATSVEGRPTSLPAAVTAPADADREVHAQRGVTTWFFGLLAGFQVLLALAVLPLLRRARRHAGPGGPVPVSPRVVAVVEALLVAAALAVPAALLADLVPWWRGDQAGLYFALVTVLLLGAATVGVRFHRGYANTLGPLGLVAGLAALSVGADVATGAQLQLNGVTGYSALAGGRYTGVGVVGLGVFVAGTLLSAGWLAQRVRRSWRPAVMALVGAVGVLLVGSPYLGGDPVGAVALTAGVCVASAMSTGGWLTFGRVAWATIAGLAVTAGFAVLDMTRPEPERGSLGRFLAALREGTGGLTMHRSGASSFEALVGSPLTIIALAGMALVWFALLQPWGGLKRLFGIYPAIRAGMAGIVVAALIGGVLGGSALNFAGAAATVAIPMAALAALRVLDHAADRTQPAAVPDVPVSSITADSTGSDGTKLAGAGSGAAGSGKVPTARSALTSGGSGCGGDGPGRSGAVTGSEDTVEAGTSVETTVT